MRKSTRRQVELSCTALCLATLLIAAVVMVGWFLHAPLATMVLPGLATMKANTALALMTASLGLLARSRPSLAIPAAAVTAVFGVLTMVEYVTGVSLGLDELVIADPATTSMPFPGRMSPATAVSFAAIGCSLSILSIGHRRSTLVLAHALAVVPGLVSYLSLVGYIYGVERLYNFGPYVSVALHTAVCFGMLSAVMLLTRDREGWTKGFVDRPIATDVLVRLIAIALLLPFATGLLIEAGAHLGFYQPLFGPALFAMLASLAFMWLALQAALAVRKAEDAMHLARDEAEAKARALVASDQRYQFAVENIAQLVWKTQADGALTFVNRKWLDYTGKSAEAVAGTGWIASVHPDDLQRTRECWQDALAGRHPYEIEYRLRRHDGAYRWFKVAGSLTIDADDGTEYWIGSSTDIQDIVEAKDVIARSQEELERLVAARTATLMDIEAQLRQSQKMEAVGQLTGGVAHDFNNLLTIIRSSVDLLRRPGLKEQRRERYLEVVSETVDRAAKLTGQLLAFARRQALKPEVFEVGGKLKGIADMLDTITGSRIRVVLDIPEPRCFVRADLSQFETALINMAVNARDAMDGEGTLQLRLTCRSNLPHIRGHAGSDEVFAVVAMTDSGIGIPADQLASIFEPFYTTKDVGKGTGLGLSQVFGFAKQSGGDVDVTSEVGRGTTFILYLPEVEPPVEPDRKPANEPAVSGAGQRILVVEDNIGVGEFCTQMLEDLGFRTEWAMNGEDALHTLGASGAGFDAIFSDVVMPGMGGVCLARELRQRFPKLPVVLTSGYSHVLAQDADHGFDLLHKPYSAEQLSQVLRRAMARGSAGPVLTP